MRRTAERYPLLAAHDKRETIESPRPARVRPFAATARPPLDRRSPRSRSRRSDAPVGLIDRLRLVDDAILVETRAFNDELERLLARQPSVHTVPPEVTRRLRREGSGVFPPPVYSDRALDLEASGRAGPIPIRAVRPGARARGIYVHIHGGGWTLGAADLQDVLLETVADVTGFSAASVGYRLAPEHPYPAGPDDCEDAVRWLLEHGPDALDAPARFVIGGESAGAHLAVLTLLRLRDRHGISDAFEGANLVFGVFDLGQTPSQRLWGDRNLILSGPIMAWFSELFLPGTSSEDRRDPSVSPLYADLHGMPPALFTVGTLDPLLDDSLFAAARWQAAGSRAELAVWPEAIHGFTAFPIAVARAANIRQLEFVRTLP
jgi:acetyl esterase